jgi:DNA-binding NarL/FixJ family response regulator
MPALSACLRSIADSVENARMIVLDPQRSKEELFSLLSQGIRGFVSYSEVESDLLAAIHKVAQGHLWIDPQMLEEFVSYLNQKWTLKRKRSGALTNREKHVIELLRRRLSNKEIGSILRVSESTVKFHVSNVLAKLQVSDRHCFVQEARLQK